MRGPAAAAAGVQPDGRPAAGQAEQIRARLGDPVVQQQHLLRAVAVGREQRQRRAASVHLLLARPGHGQQAEELGGASLSAQSQFLRLVRQLQNVHAHVPAAERRQERLSARGTDQGRARRRPQLAVPPQDAHLGARPATGQRPGHQLARLGPQPPVQRVQLEEAHRQPG